jgi:tRNA A-37 threonylcarbamoyl transferase component Bud32
MRTEVIGDGHGRRVFSKRADDADEAARLRREADVLQVAGHPGLVELLTFEDGLEPRLTTAHIEGRTAAEAGIAAVDEVAGVVASVASTLADLHALGLVHGAVVPEHVVLDGEGRPVLCSLGYGGLAGERASCRAPWSPAAADPSQTDDDRLDPAVDVYGLGALLSFLLAEAESGRNGVAAHALRRLAERAVVGDPRDRPSAREIADAVHEAVVGARLPGSRGDPAAAVPPDPLAARRRQGPLDRWRLAQGGSGTGPSRSPLARRRALTAAALALAGAVAAGAWLVLARAGPAERTGPGPSLAGPAPTTASTAATGTATTVPPPPSRPGCPEVDQLLSADVDRDGCADGIRFAKRGGRGRRLPLVGGGGGRPRRRG